MPVVKAMQAYKQEKLNCAQSVLRGFQEHLSVDEDQIAAAKQLGGGRAENGCCGALYAAWLLIREEEAKESIRLRFIAEAGSDKCREIRKLGRLSCGECVELAAGLLLEKLAIENTLSAPGDEK